MLNQDKQVKEKNGITESFYKEENKTYKEFEKKALYDEKYKRGHVKWE